MTKHDRPIIILCPTFEIMRITLLWTELRAKFGLKLAQIVHCEPFELQTWVRGLSGGILGQETQ